MIQLEEMQEAYPEEILTDCKRGFTCSYGICDECPNTLEIVRSNKDDE